MKKNKIIKFLVSFFCKEKVTKVPGVHFNFKYSVMIMLQDSALPVDEIVKDINPLLRSNVDIINMNNIIPSGVNIYRSLKDAIDIYLKEEKSIILITSKTLYKSKGKSSKDLAKKYANSNVICITRSDRAVYDKKSQTNYVIGKTSEDFFKLMKELDILT